MLSIPGDFPAFRLLTASSTSSLSTGRLSALCVCVWLLSSRLGSGVRSCIGSTQSTSLEQLCFLLGYFRCCISSLDCQDVSAAVFDDCQLMLLALSDNVVSVVGLTAVS